MSLIPRGPRDYLGFVEGEFRLCDASIPVIFELYGHRVKLAAEPCVVLDRVEIDGRDVSERLPAQAIEVLTAHVNRPPLSEEIPTW